MKTEFKKQQKGFTIIEVLIVLAIAGLIILIVFLAVPALQRNSRNTQRKTQAARYLSAVTEWQNNNNGVPVTTAAVTATPNGINDLAGDGGQMAEPTAVTTPPTQAAFGTLDVIRIVPGARCLDTHNTVPSGPRSVAIQYAVEGSGSSAQSQCDDL